MIEHPYLYVTLAINDKIRAAECSWCHDPIPCKDGTLENAKARFIDHVNNTHPDSVWKEQKTASDVS